jgi:hypothetical protein
MGGCYSSAISQQLGDSYAAVRTVAENIDALLALAAQLSATENVLNLVRGTTSVISDGEITVDLDNSYIAIAPEAGLTDDLNVITGAAEGQVVLLRPELPTQTITLKALTALPITDIDAFTNIITVNAHGLVNGQAIILNGAELPSDIPAGTYYVAVVGVNQFRIATTEALALAGTTLDLVENGGGFLQFGNIALDADAVIAGYDSIMLVRDGLTYTVLATTGIPGAVAAALSGLQPSDPVLTALSALVLAGQAGKILQINNAGGFDIVELNYAAVNHPHTLAEVTGLVAALEGKSPTNHDHAGVYSLVAHTHDGTYAAAAHNHDSVYQKKVTISVNNPSGGSSGDIWFKVPA